MQLILQALDTKNSQVILSPYIKEVFDYVREAYC